VYHSRRHALHCKTIDSIEVPYQPLRLRASRYTNVAHRKHRNPYGSELAPIGFCVLTERSWHNPSPFIFSTCKGGNSLTVSSKTLHLFGIKACDTMKKARTWLDEHAVSYDFHDYKAVGIDREHLTQWCDEHGWQVVLNRAGTTFRKLDDERKTDLDQPKAIELMLAQPSMIKRPVLDLGDRTLIGFKPDIYAAALK
jgi:Spx/MgsR family transcriptional regulator